MGKTVLFIFGFSYMDEVELAPHDQRDPQRMRECFDAVVGKIGWMDDGLESLKHDVDLPRSAFLRMVVGSTSHKSASRVG